MRFTLLLICVILAGGCAMPPLPVAQPTPVTANEDVAAGWERYQDAETDWNFAFPPGSRVARETDERPWYTLITTPTPTPAPLPTATPIPAGRPGYALYRGRGVYYETPRLQVEYDMSQWSLLALDYFDQAHLVNRQRPDCVLRLQGGPRMMLGPAVVEWITLGEQVLATFMMLD